MIFMTKKALLMIFLKKDLFFCAILDSTKVGEVFGRGIFSLQKELKPCIRFQKKKIRTNQDN